MNYSHKNKALVFLKRLFYNPRLDWHKANFNLLRDCEKILDVGCGKGLFVGLAPEKIAGVDYNYCSLKECASKGYTVITGHVLNLPFANQSFDGVYCADLIEHFLPSDARCLLVEMFRVLKVGGFLVMATPLPSKMFWNDPTHVRPYPPYSLLSYCIQNTKEDMGTQTNHESLPYDTKFVKLIWRHTPFYQLPLHIYFEEDRIKLSNLMRLSSLLFMLSNLLYRIGIKHPRPEGYVIVMQKI